MNDTASPIAAVVDDLRGGRIDWLHDDIRGLLAPTVDHVATNGEVVDVTAIFNSIRERNEAIGLYEDHPCIAPPWPGAVLGFVNGYGNVWTLVTAAWDRTSPETPPLAVKDKWETAEPVDWDQVRWVIQSWVFLGGVGGGRSIPTFGPLFGWMLAVSADGEPLDIHWLHIDENADRELFTNAQLTLLGTLGFLNCSNVSAVEPARSRAVRKRLDRAGVRVTEVVVRPTRRRSEGNGRHASDEGVPLTSVRGHYKHHGACCPSHEPRGLLFGKLTGRYWVPAFARGSADHGQVEHSYRLKPDD